MQQLTPAGDTAVRELAQRYGVSVDAVSTLLSAVAAGGGTMAQFYHPELGGGGQWMRGGMTMVGDMFNSGLQSRVSALCSELSTLLGSTQVFTPSTPEANGSSMNHGWWPADLGTPSSTGGQNNSRYAYFPTTRRLVVDSGGRLAIYDTLDHQIGGVQQQQGGQWGSLSFSSQFGTFTVESLPRVGGVPVTGSNDAQSHHASPTASPEPAVSQPHGSPAAVSQQPASHAPLSQAAVSPAPVSQSPVSQSPVSQSPAAPLPARADAPPAPSYSRPQSEHSSHGVQSSRDVLEAIERLGQLFNQGLLSNDEFQNKKAELLSRL